MPQGHPSGFKGEGGSAPPGDIDDVIDIFGRRPSRRHGHYAGWSGEITGYGGGGGGRTTPSHSGADYQAENFDDGNACDFSFVICIFSPDLAQNILIAITEEASKAFQQGWLTPAQVREREAWVEQALRTIYRLGNDRSRKVPWPERYKVRTIEFSPRPYPEDPTADSVVELSYILSPLGITILVGDITIFPNGATSYEETFISVGHEIGHFLWPFEHDRPEAFGQELWRIHIEGGPYQGPRP